MSVKTFAAIDVGSFETALKIYEFSGKNKMKEIDLLKRPKVTIDGLSSITGVNFGHFINQHIEIDVKYKGYIEKAKRDARHLQEMESVALPDDLDYAHMENISLEARQKLDAVRPQTLGQASRISGINPSDIAVLAMKVR